MYQNILVAIDDSDTARCALNEAINIARQSSGHLIITHVADETLMGMHGRTFSTTLNIDHALAAIAESGRQLLAEAVKAADGLSVETVLLEARDRRVSEAIHTEAVARKADLIVVGRQGKNGLARLILGSVAEQLARMAQCSLLLVRNH